MTGQEQIRRARGRARMARRQRSRIRIACFGVLGLFAMIVMSSTAFDFVKRERVRYLEPHRTTVYNLPHLPTVVAQAKPKKKLNLLPRLLRIDELFPKYRNPEPIDPNEGGGEEGDTTQVKDDLVVLDDLTAAPPKDMFLDAIYENGGLATRSKAPPVELSEDFTGNPYEVIGYGPPAIIPEPSTGLMLGLGLSGLSAFSRSRRRRLIAAQKTASSRSAEL